MPDPTHRVHHGVGFEKYVFAAACSVKFVALVCIHKTGMQGFSTNEVMKENPVLFWKREIPIPDLGHLEISNTLYTR